MPTTEPSSKTPVDNTDLEALAERYADGEALLEATTNYYHIYDTLSNVERVIGTGGTDS